MKLTRVTWHFGGLELKNKNKKIEFCWGEGWGSLFFFFFELLKENAISFTLAERERERELGRV